MNTRCLFLILVALAALAVSGCSGDGDVSGEAATATSPPDQPEPEGRRPARTLPLPAPAGADQGTARGGKLEWTVPDGWTVEQPSSSMRLAQYRAPGPAGDGECVVYYFGPGQGGDPASNAVRWANQFSQPDGSSSVDLMKVTELQGTTVPLRVVEVTGTYNGGMTMTDAPAEALADHMLLGGIAMGSDAPWFFKFTGPEATLREQRQAFLDMMASVRAGG